MTKLTFDVDFTKDPKEILQEIQERAKAEVAKRESKIKSAAFLSNLHEKVNQEIGTDFKTVNDLIRALTAYANPKLRDKISSTSPSGRRVTISMSPELFEEIKSKLAQPNSNKAAIARETGASVVQVRKVANGGFDAKFASSKDVKASKSVKSDPTQKVQREVPALEPSSTTPPSDDAPILAPPATTLDLPQTPLLPEPTVEVEIKHKDSATELSPPLPPSVDDGMLDQPTLLAPPQAPSLDLPPTPLIPEPISPTEAADDTGQESSTSVLPPIVPPSIGEDIAEVTVPPAPPSLDLPPATSIPEPAESIENEQSLPELPTIAPPSMGEEIPDIPAPLAPPPAPSLDLPTVPSVPDHADSLEQEEPTPPLPPIAPPSMGEETPEVPAPLAPPPAPSLDLPPTPPSPTAPESGVTDSPSPINTPAPQKPSLSLKVKGTKLGIGAKKGKPTLSLKPGKKKPGGLKITRPPMKPPSA
ncbi:hypothetical protein N9N55_00095 [Opitutales bacterium]|nr:hypothetical protein [Opitutales bacterium]